MLAEFFSVLLRKSEFYTVRYRDPSWLFSDAWHSIKNRARIKRTKEKETWRAALWSRLILVWVRRPDIGLNVTRTPLHGARGWFTPLGCLLFDPRLFWLTGTNTSDVHPWGHSVIALDPLLSSPRGRLSETSLDRLFYSDRIYLLVPLCCYRAWQFF